MATDIRNVPAALDEDLKVREYISKLADLRSTGVTRVNDLKQQIIATKKSRMLSDEAKAKMIDDCRKQVAVAQADAARNKAKIDALTKEAVGYVNELSARIEKNVYAEQDAIIARLKDEYKAKVESIKAESARRIAGISISDSKEKRDEVQQIRYEEKSALFDARSHFTGQVDRAKATKNQAYVDHVQTNRTLRNGKTNFKEDMTLKWKDYVNRFKASTFFLNNGLYIAVLIFFIVCVIIAPMQGRGQLLSLPNILTILEQSSTRMFYALGVAGLILLAGTDLSVGRMVALGSVTTGLLLHRGVNIVRVFGAEPWNFDSIPMGARVVIALCLSIIFCVAFSSFAGVFTAKLKIHPFISTMSTQLIIYGLLFFGTSGTPTGSIDSGIKDLIGGRWELGIVNGQLITFPKLTAKRLQCPESPYSRSPWASSSWPESSTAADRSWKPSAPTPRPVRDRAMRRMPSPPASSVEYRSTAVSERSREPCSASSSSPASPTAESTRTSSSSSRAPSSSRLSRWTA